MLLPWHHKGTMKIALAPSAKLYARLRWLHCPALSAHIAIIAMGRLRIIRIRSTPDHARRLGLPII